MSTDTRHDADESVSRATQTSIRQRIGKRL